MITVGLDFGTHQTKVCIEDKDGVELSYSFMKFKDTFYRKCYTLPSIIGIGRDNKLSYGYLPRTFNGQIIRYFKQSTFRPSPNMSQIDAMYYSTWYLAYILFDLESLHRQEFTIQMGAPTDSSHVDMVKVIATRIIVSAYRLVEEVFKNDKKKFLATTMDELKEKTELVAYSDEIKEEYGILVFPEAYACLKPLISQKKLATGMNLMIDIGGGTTDISFFTIESKDPKNPDCNEFIPQVYYFTSVGKGLNYLTRSDDKTHGGVDSNVKDVSEIDMGRRHFFFQEIRGECMRLRNKLLREFKNQTSLDERRLLNALKNRPLVYCGGGSTFKTLRESYEGYQDKKLISHQEWDVKCIKEIDIIIKENLCPILSTAYGLSISTVNDDIVMKPLKDIFENIRGAEEEQRQQTTRINTFGSAYGGFSYGDDWDAWK